MRPLPWISVALIAFALGCKSESPTPSSSSSSTSMTAENAPAPKGTEPKPDLSQIPAELKSDAYEYYGLGNSKPMKLEIEMSGANGRKLMGEQTTTLKEIKDGVPVFTIDRTGEISILGMQEVRLEKDGIYNSASTVAKVGTHDLEMPAKLTPGATWSSRTEVDQPDKSLENDSTFKVVGMQPVKTKVGEHQALLITSSGKGTVAGQKVTTTSKSWYVKGLGSVKTVLVTTFPKGKVETITIQETK